MHYRSTSVVVAALLISAPLVAQAPKNPHAFDGHPDLQGVWNFSTVTPLERPAEFAGREFLTDAEARAFEQRTIERNNRDNRESSAEADVSSAYNEFWWDRGVHAARVHGKVRTSLIVDPPDGRPHLPASVRLLLGDSRGHWDGDTLVVETTNFTDKTTVRGSGPGLRLVERFTREGASTLLYEFTVDDPASFTKPWTAVLPMARTDAQLYEYACHEGNYAMTGILRGARAGESNR